MDRYDMTGVYNRMSIVNCGYGHLFSFLLDRETNNFISFYLAFEMFEY
jgi:hypothetical protein